MQKADSEYWELDIIQQEQFLDVCDEDFQKVIDRLEGKGNIEDIQILKLNEVRRLRVKSGQKFKRSMDLNAGGNYVMDSSYWTGAKRII